MRSVAEGLCAQPENLRTHWQWPMMLGAVAALAFLLRWYYISTAVVVNPIRGDAIQYFSYALNLVEHGVFSGATADPGELTPDSYRDPGYPMFLAAWMKVFGANEAWYHAVLLCQAALSALTIPLMMQLGRSWLAPWWCVMAGVLVAIWPQAITISGTLLTEALMGFLCALAMLACCIACTRNHVMWAIVAGLVFGLAALTNAVLIPFGVLLAAYVGWRGLAVRRVWVALLLAAVLLPGAWQVRNLQIPDSAASDQSSAHRAVQNFVQGANPDYHDVYRPSFRGDADAKARMDEISREIILFQNDPKAGLAQIADRFKRQPLRYLVWYVLEKPWHFWGWGIRIGQDDLHVYPVRNTPYYSHPVMVSLAVFCETINPVLALMLFGCLIGFVLWHLTQRRWHSEPSVGFSITCVIVLYVMAVYVLLQSEARYAIPFRPYQMLLVAAACQALVSGAWRNRSGTVLDSAN